MWKKRLWRIFAPLVMTILICGAQTVVWPNLISSLPAPPFWLLLIVWVSLYRNERETILLVYLMGLLATAFTAMPLKMMLFSLMILYVLIRRVKERVFWTGMPYFVMASAASVTAFQVIYMILSAVLEPTRTAWLPLDRLVVVLWSVPAAILIYSLMTRVDQPSLDSSDRERSYV
ncbi:MAG TPA: hypothetical protein PL182_11755 [Pseudobdellovibrionaceae bacterium]|nr:hypothetical protein [Pseudobdellovibrionaceae bacterium]